MRFIAPPPSIRRRFSGIFPLVLGGLLGVLSLSARAQTTWVAAPQDALWTNAANWTGSVPTTTATNTAATAVGVLTFSSSSITTTNINGDHAVLGMVFTGAANFTTNASTGVLYLYDSGLQVQGGTQTFGVTVRLRGTSGAVSIANDGTLNLSGGLWVHRESAGTTTVTFSGTGDTTVGNFARRASTDDLNIVKTGAGTLTITGSNTNEADTASGRAIKGTLTITGGKVRINDEAELGSNPVAANAGQITLNGGTLGAYGTLTIDDPNRGITLGTNGGTFDVESSAFTLTVANKITGTGGSLTKTGTGKQVLTAANDYTGATNVNGGTLLVNGSNTSSAATVSNAGTIFGGTGTVGNVTVNSGAILLGGDGSTAAGALTSGGNISLLDNSEIKLTLGAGGTHSSLARTGGLWAFDSDQAFTFNLAGATTTTYTNIITGLTGTEAGLSTISTWKIIDPGVTGTFSYNGAGGVNLTVATVPEPGTVVALFSGLGLLLGLQRTRRASRAR